MTDIDNVFHGADVHQSIAAQRAYVAEAERRTKFGLLIPEAFVRGIRDLGYRSNSDALAELIDNSIQAFADRVDVIFGYEGTGSEKKPTQMAVLDNGHGMDPAMIRMAMMWGGTHRENDRAGLGRYGYGLPCASVSLGRRFTVYSHVAGRAIHAITLDLDLLATGAYTDVSGDFVMPTSVPTELPAFVAECLNNAQPRGWACGTVVVLEKLDRLEWTTTQGLRENLCRHFGVTYHKLRDQTALYIDGQFVDPVDPLFLTPKFQLHALDEDRAQALEPIKIETRASESEGNFGAITLRYAWFPPSFGSIDKERDAVGVNANARFPIIKNYHGVIFSRNGRLIDVHTRTPWTTFINNDRYIKIEVEFSADLDEVFGVTTSKQQVKVSPLAWDLLLQAGLPKAIEQLRTKVKEAKSRRHSIALVPRAGEKRPSEIAMSAVLKTSSSDASLAQQSLDLHAPPCRTEFAHAPGQSFFRMVQSDSTRILQINTAHRFYTDLYSGPASTAEMRSALEVVLFSIGDVALKHESNGNNSLRQDLVSWSLHLELALERLASGIHHSEQ